jgi:hypothetical protein
VARMGEIEMLSVLWRINLTCRDHLEERSLNERILLKLILKKCHGRMWTGLIWLRTETSGGIGFHKVIDNYKTSPNSGGRTVRRGGVHEQQFVVANNAFCYYSLTQTRKPAMCMFVLKTTKSIVDTVCKPPR